MDKTSSIFFASFICIFIIVSNLHAAPTASVDKMGDNQNTNTSYDDDGTVYVKLSNSCDEERTITEAKICWDVTFTWLDISPTVTSANHTYASEGTKCCYYKVKDSAGIWSSVAGNSIIVDLNSPSAEAGSNQTVDEDVSVSFDGSVSSDLTTLEYKWDFNNDGTYNTSLSYSATANHTYNTPGTYTVKLYVIDRVGRTDTDTLTVTVNDVTNPVCAVDQMGDDAGSDDDYYDNDGTVYVTLSNSDNAGVAEAKISWDGISWDAPGTWSAISPAVTSANHTYTSEGTKYCHYKVKDAAGNWSAVEFNFITIDAQPPTDPSNLKIEDPNKDGGTIKGVRS